jgi:hypothetical protein
VIEDLRTGRLDWSAEWLRDIAQRFLPPEDEANQKCKTHSKQRST